MLYIGIYNIYIYGCLGQCILTNTETHPALPFHLQACNASNPGKFTGIFSVNHFSGNIIIPVLRIGLRILSEERICIIINIIT